MARNRDRDEQPADDDRGAPMFGGPTPGARPIAGAPHAGAPPYGAAPYGSPPPGAPPFGPPGASPLPPGAAAHQPGRSRPGLILLVSFLVQLAIVLAVGNTWVVRKSFSFGSSNDFELARALSRLPSVYAWRLTPTSYDPGHQYAASLAGLFAFFVVAALLSLALVRGPVTFGRAFLGVWLAVITATLVDGMVFRAVFDTRGYTNYVGSNPIIRGFFGSAGGEVAAGVLVGLVAGLVAGIVAVASRRRPDVVLSAAPPELPPYVEPGPPPPWHGDGPAGPAGPAATPRYVPQNPPPTAAPMSLRKDESPATDEQQATTQFPAVTPARREPEPAGDDQPTTAFRRPDAVTPETTPARADEPSAPSQTHDQPTQAFPRPPDDEDLGHQHDDE